jgi:hypothetical protein
LSGIIFVAGIATGLFIGVVIYLVFVTIARNAL